MFETEVRAGVRYPPPISWNIQFLIYFFVRFSACFLCFLGMWLLVFLKP